MKELIIRDGFPRFRFGLRTLLELLTLIAVGLGAYLAGRESGFHQGVHSAEQPVQNKFSELSAKVHALEKERAALAAKLDQK